MLSMLGNGLFRSAFNLDDTNSNKKIPTQVIEPNENENFWHIDQIHSIISLIRKLHTCNLR